MIFMLCILQFPHRFIEKHLQFAQYVSFASASFGPQIEIQHNNNRIYQRCNYLRKPKKLS